MEKEHVIIIGAGICGLITARTLLSAGFSITMLEADDRVGGRIRTEYVDQVPVPVELGAEFVHGKLPETLKLCKEAALDVLPVEGKMYRKNPAGWTEQHEMAEHWDRVLRRMKKLPEDTTLDTFLEKEFGDDDDFNIRKQVKNYAGGFDLADTSQVSVKSLYNEWSNEDEVNFRLPEGYKALVDFIYKDCIALGLVVELGDPVTQVDHEPGEVTVYTRSEKKHMADRVVCTIPIGVLQKALAESSINFTPELDQYVVHARNIGMGGVIKYVLCFDEIFWQPDAGFIFGDEMIPTWWTHYPQPVSVLTGWAGGNRADQLRDHSSDQLLDVGLKSLSAICDIPVAQLRDRLKWSVVKNWETEPRSLGAYTYSKPASAAAVAALMQPVNDTVYFAGEGIYDGTSPGTVEAAIVSGQRVAKNIMRIK